MYKVGGRDPQKKAQFWEEERDTPSPGQCPGTHLMSNFIHRAVTGNLTINSQLNITTCCKIGKNHSLRHMSVYRHNCGYEN